MLLWGSSTSLAILVKLWLLPVSTNVVAWPCSSERLVHSAVSFDLELTQTKPPSGHFLRFIHDSPLIIQHPCTRRFAEGIAPSMYLGEKVFISFDRFESSLQPVAIPAVLANPPALISSAAFIHRRRVVLVVNRKVYLYVYEKLNLWLPAQGINSPVTELSQYSCCFNAEDPVCFNMTRIVLAYDTGSLASDSQIFYSSNGGFSFKPMEGRPYPDGILLGVYHFASSSEIGMLLKRTEINSTLTYFTYGDLEYMTEERGTPFDLSLHDKDKVLSILPPGLRGFIILWSHDHLLSSSNNGLTTEIITVLPTDRYPNSSFPTHDQGVCSLTASSSEVAAITKNGLFYGSLDMVSSQMVHLGEKKMSKPDDPCEAMMFDHIGMLSIVRSVPSNLSDYYDFHKCTINVQAKLMSLRPPMQPCPIEILSGEFHERMFYIDMKQQLSFNVTFVPKPGTGAHPYVTVSNPHVLAFRAHIVQEDYTYDGNPKYILHIKLLEQQFSGMAHEDFQNDYLTGKVSSITVDVYNKGIFCVDMHPLTALIAVDCPPKKHIRIAKTTTACSKGLFKPRLLQKFSYIIDRSVYDPKFLGRKGLPQEDLNVTYRYDRWGCPLLLYYDSPWIPLLELWDNDEFVEYVPADFVLIEVNGMHNYDYLLNEVEANCISGSQNWTTQMLLDPDSHPTTSWSRHNYHSCKIPKGNDLLPSAASKYQVLNKNEKNRVIFPQYNGIYVFKVIVIDTLYSYCELTTFFSVYVHGALPRSEINAGKTLVSFLVLIFGSILIVYYFPKLLKENARMKSVWN